MGFHTYPLDRAEALEDVSRFRMCSREELVGALDPAPSAVVADVGSGTGFFTDEVAPFVETCYAVDVQSGMHERYREKGMPGNVEAVTAEAEDLPFPDGHLDGVFSTMTYHEFATETALAELRRVLTDGGRFVAVDWTSEGNGAEGPPLDERFDAETARDHLTAAGYEPVDVRTRPETFVVIAEI
jgi:ubiquinone/menaquinone biosynthesis C-methylase UbiE